MIKSIEINIGDVCNNKCKFCMVEHDTRRMVDFEKIKLDIILAKRQGFESIGFLGGEFTLHPEIFKILHLCRLLKFKIVHIISNGRKFKDKKFLAKLIESGANRFSVSIHSHKSNIEDDLTQVNGGFKEKIQGIRNLIFFYKKGLINYPVSINLVINNKNYLDLLKTLSYYHKLGIRDFRLNFMWIRGRAEEFKDLYLKYENFIPQIDKIIASANNQGFNVAFDGIPPCFMLKNGLKYIGEYQDYNTDVIGYNNPTGARQRFNWQKLRKNSLKTKHLKCKDCEYNNRCEGVWKGYIKVFGWSEFF